MHAAKKQYISTKTINIYLVTKFNNLFLFPCLYCLVKVHLNTLQYHISLTSVIRLLFW